MRRFLSLVAVLALTACGGGGSNSSTSSLPPTSHNPSIANTSLSSYMPFHAGNTWTFTSGSHIFDAGPVTISCSCPINHLIAERLDIFDTTGAYASSQIWSHGDWPLAPFAGHRLTYIIGTTTNVSGSAVTFAGYNADGSIPGFPLIDDTPTNGETFTYSSAINGSATAVITGVGSTQQLGSSVINDVAVSVVSASGITLGFGFARGVGIVDVGASSNAVQLSSFTVDQSSSSDVNRNPSIVVGGKVDPRPLQEMMRKF